MPTSARSPWPAYFAPRVGGTASAAEPILRIPTHVLDRFYVRPPHSPIREAITVLGCLQGDLDVLAGTPPASLSEQLRAHIQLIEVGQQCRYRAITTNDLYIATLAALEQPIAHQSLNAPIHLYVTMQARLSFTNKQLQMTPLAIDGCMTVGRLNILSAYANGAMHALPNPNAPAEQTYHLLVPIAPVEHVIHGHGIALIYPLLDPAILDSADNTHIMLRIIYELLARLQQDLLQSAPQHQFATLALPVPSRRRLEADLQADGYQIRGDRAIKSADAPPSTDSTHSFLDRLRQIARQWVAPQIELPPQATPQLYQQIITDLLESLAQPTDQQLLRAMAEFTESDVGPTDELTAATSTRSLPHPIVPTQPNVAARVHSSAHQSPQRDWASDFANVTSVPVRRNRQGAWWKSPTRDTSIEPNDLTAADEWMADFLAERATTPSKPIPTTDQSEPEKATWAKDFEPIAPPDPSTRDWAKDFE